MTPLLLNSTVNDIDYHRIAVRNITAQAQDVPMIELSLHSKDGEPLVTWLVDVKNPASQKNERVFFILEYQNPPVDAVKLRYCFADETVAAASGEEPRIENVMGI